MAFEIMQAVVALLALQCAGGQSWRWPDDAEGAESVRIDDKVGFVDATQRNGRRSNRDDVQADEESFRQPTETDGFYNRPPGAGRYPVRVEEGSFHDREIRINGRPAYSVDSGNTKETRRPEGTLDALQYCKCVATPNCKGRADYSSACGGSEYLCCYAPRKQNSIRSEYFNEVDDERPMLFPSQSENAGPFPPPAVQSNGVFGPGQAHENVFFRNINRQPEFQTGILVGPGGPTGEIGVSKKQVLVGPDGPTGVVSLSKPVLVGPQGPTGNIGPVNTNSNENVVRKPLGSPADIGHSETAQRGVLVGPGGPTGIIGPAFNRPFFIGQGGPASIVGPSFNRPVLVGPGGSTGIIGPSSFGRPSQRPGVLVGPGGPTGIIGPGRRVLVGPGGPTGQIGPRNFFGK